MSTIADKLRENREKYLRHPANIRADEDFTPEAKARRIAPVYQEAKNAENRLRQQRVDELEKRRKRAEREVFTAPPMYGSDPALREMNYRAALLTVAKVTDPEELSKTLEMANLTGDRTLARAVAWRANDLKYANVVEKYLESDDDARKKWQEWSTAHEEKEHAGTLGGAIASAAGRIEEPPELHEGGQGVSQEGSQGLMETLQRAQG